MSHQRKLITTALAVTVAIALAVTLTGCGVLQAAGQAILAHRNDEAREQLKNLDLSLDAAAAVPRRLVPGFVDQWNRDTDWRIDRERSHLFDYYYTSQATGCELRLNDGAGVRAPTGDSDRASSLQTIETYLGHSGLGEATYSLHLASAEGLADVEMLAVIQTKTTFTDGKAGDVESILVATRDFTKGSKGLFIALTCQNVPADVVWERDVHPYLLVDLFPNVT